MNRHVQGFRWGSRLAFVGAVACLVLAVASTTVGALALAGKVALPFHGQWGPFTVSQELTWPVKAPSREVCSSGNVTTWHDDECINFYLRDSDTEPSLDGSYVHDADVRPVRVHYEGEMELASSGGWSPFVAHTVATRVVGLLVGAVFLFLLRRVLASAARGDVFTVGATKQVRAMGWTLIVGGVAGNVLALFGGPSALGYGSTSFGPVSGLTLGASESIDLTLVAVGALVLLLAQVYRRGLELATENALTV